MTLVRLAVSRDEQFLELTMDEQTRVAAFTSDDRKELAAIIEAYHTAVIEMAQEALPAIGVRVSEWFDGKGGGTSASPWLRWILDDFEAPLRLEILAPRSPSPAHRLLFEVPWELLCDGHGGYLAGDTLARYAPVRRVGRPREVAGPGAGPLSVLFMAAAPRGQAELSFEAEEASILALTAGMNLDLFVEETGTARELGLRAAELASEPGHALHVVHISCHGHNSPEPVLLLEDELGEEASTPVGELCEILGTTTLEQVGLLFTSACLTAASGDFSPDHDSLALGLIRSGVRGVLGWAASVHDSSASDFAAQLYAQLARGDLALEDAVARTRTKLLTKKPQADPHWHLARLYLGSRGGGLLAKLGGARRKGPALHGGFLGGDRRSPVAGPQEFVGRRRLLQDCLRALRNPESVGLLLHGPGNVGKSSLAARVVDRMSSHETVVMHGCFSGANLIEAIFNRLGSRAKTWHDRWQDCTDLDVGTALRELLDEGITDGDDRRPLLLVLDDFEQFLEPEQGAMHTTRATLAPIIVGLLRAFVHANTRSRLLLTSRHKFRLEEQALVETLCTIPLASFTEVEANKRAARAPRPPEGTEDLRARCVRACWGNPAILALLLRFTDNDVAHARVMLEQLESFDTDMRKHSHEALEDLLRTIAARELLASLAEGDRELLRRSLMFEVPVPVELARVLVESGNGECDADGEHLIALGVWEEVPDVIEGRAFTPNPLVKAYARREGMSMSEDEKAQIAGALVPPLAACWSSLAQRRTAPGRMQAGAELVELAWRCRQWQTAADFAELALSWYRLNSSIEGTRAYFKGLVEDLESADANLSASLYLAVVDLHERSDDAAFVHNCIKHGLARCEDLDDALSVRGPLLFCRAKLRQRSGLLEEACVDLKQLIELYPQPEHALMHSVVIGKVVDSLIVRGELDEALRILGEDLLPLLEQFGYLRDWAVARSKMAYIWRVRGDLGEALRILGEELLPIFDRLGDVRERALAMGQIADILMLLGDLDEALRIRQEEELPVFEALGDAREWGIAMTKIGDIRVARGEHDEALRILLEEVLPMYERLGDVRERAIALGGVANILIQHGKLDEALHLLREEMLPVFEQIGDAHSRAGTLGTIAGILMQRGELDEVLRIRREEELPVYERIGDVRACAGTKHQVGDILLKQGKLDQALRIWRELLPTYETLGDIRDLLRGRVALVVTLIQSEPSRENRREVVSQLVAAMRESRYLGGSETETIADLIRQLGGDPEAPPYGESTRES